MAVILRYDGREFTVNGSADDLIDRIEEARNSDRPWLDLRGPAFGNPEFLFIGTSTAISITEDGTGGTSSRVW